MEGIYSFLQKIQERKKAYFQNILDIPKTGNNEKIFE